MSTKITEHALREFIRERLLEEAGDDASAEETNPAAVSTMSIDKPDTPLEPTTTVVDTTLGPPIADPGYVPQNPIDLKSAVDKMLDTVPEKAIGVAYKVIKKSLDNLHDVLRQRAEISPGVPVIRFGAEGEFDVQGYQEEPVVQMGTMDESTHVEKLLHLLAEQGLFGMLGGEKEEEEEEEEVEVRSATYDDDREVSPPTPKAAEPVDDKSQFDRFFKKKMEDMLALAKARHPEKLQGVMDWNSVDDNLDPEEHLAIMDAYDEALGKKYPVLAKASGRDFEPPVKSTLVAAVEDFMKSGIEGTVEIASDEIDDVELDDRFTRAGSLERIPLGKKSSQDQATKEAIRRELYRMSVGTKDYYQGLIDILRDPESLGDKKLQKALGVAIKDFAEEESVPESGSDYFLFITYMNQDLRPDPKENYRNTVLARVAEHMMSQAGFAGSKGGAQRPHINKDSTIENLNSAIAGIKSRKDRSDADSLVKLSDILNKMLPKGETVPVVNITDKEEVEVEEKPQVTRSSGGKTFRRKRETELAESMTPADAILLSSPVQPDLDKALMVVKGIA